MAMAIATSSFAQKGQKIGHINSNDLLTAMPERAEIQKQLDDLTTQLKVTLEAMGKERETKVAEFQAQQNNMTDLVKENKIKEITDLEKRIADFQENAQTELEKKNQELMAPIIDKAKEAIDAVAKENNYTYIIDTVSGVVLFSIDGDNILPLVKKKLGIQ